MKTSAVIRELMAAGVTGDALVMAIERIEAASEPVRSSAAERQKRYRERNKSVTRDVTRDVCDGENVTSDACDVTRDGLEQKENTPHTPQKKNINIYTPPMVPPQGSKAVGSRLPVDWMPEPLPSDFKTRHSLTQEFCAEQLDQFRDYWTAQPGAKGRKTDWQATWRNWLRKASEYRSRGSPAQPRKTAFQNTMTNLAEIFADEQQEENDRDAIRKLSVSR